MNWWYDSLGRLSGEQSPTNGNRVFGPKQVHELGPVVVTRSGGVDTVTTVLRDRLGSTIDVIDGGYQSVNAVNARTYDAYGVARNANWLTERTVPRST
jgi:hypothetical protein